MQVHEYDGKSVRLSPDTSRELSLAEWKDAKIRKWRAKRARRQQFEFLRAQKLEASARRRFSLFVSHAQEINRDERR